MTILRPIAPLGLNGLELACIGLAVTGIAVMGARRGWTGRGTLAALLLLFPVLALTAAEATQFMTMDELGISAMVMNPADRALGQVSDGAFQTGILLALPIVHILQRAGADPATIRMLLKAAWWLVGNGLVAAIAFALLAVRSRRERDGAEPVLFAATFAGLSLLPTTQMALKTVNYDLLSFALSVLALLLLAGTAVRGDRPARLWPVIVPATLAAQEKLVAGPVLVVAILWLALGAVSERAALWRRAADAGCAALRAIALSLLITLASLTLYHLLGPAHVRASFWLLALGPVSSWTWVPFGLFWPIHSILQWRALVGAVAIAALVALAALGGVAMPMLLRRWHRIARLPSRVVIAITASFTACLFAVGVIGVAAVQPYWAPFKPTPLARLAILQKLNGAALHVGATSYRAHVLGLVVYALAVLVVAVPSAIWASGFVGLAACAGRCERCDRVRLATGGMLIGASILLPIAAALTGIPFANRYFNIAIALLAGGLGMLALAGLLPPAPARPRPAVFALAALFIALCCWETLPFRPLFAAFRPFWLEYGDSRRAEPGRLNASWMGWGEDVMAAGKMVEAACMAHDPRFAGVPCSSVTLYVMDSGAWLPGSSVIHVENYAKVSAAPPLDNKSFYLVNRLYLIQDEFPIPHIAADFVVSCRGYALAWIYRGDRLAAARYRFRAGDTGRRR